MEKQVQVREMLPGEKAEVEALFGRSLNIINRIAFLLSFEDALKSAAKKSGGSLVAVYDGKVVGSVSMRVQRVGGERTGFIDAFVADRELRGRGIGSSLVDGAISWLEEQRCEVIYATADRYNSPSWNTFIHRGFAVYEFPRQLRDYGLGFLRLWLSEFFFLGFGTFFLRRGRGEERPCEAGEAWHLLAAWLGVSLPWWVQALRSGQPLILVPLILAAAGVSLFAHELSQRLAARRLGLEAIFKAWESGIFFSSLLALVGSFFPSYGSTYVRRLDWWYDPRKRETGVLCSAGPAVSLALAFAFKALASLALDGSLIAAAKVGFTMNLIIVIFNLIPVQAAGGFVWDGRKILTWNRAVWALLTLSAVLLVAIDRLL